MASVKPPLDKHSQNLTLHCIELQHHKRRMRLMLMAAQHQHGEGGVSLFIINLLIQPENCRVHYQQTYLVYGPTFDTKHISHSVYFIKQILGAQLPKTLTGQTYSSEVHAKKAKGQYSLSKASNSGGYSQKNWVWVCSPLPKTHYPIHDQNLQFSLPYLWPDQNLIPYLWPDS